LMIKARALYMFLFMPTMVDSVVTSQCRADDDTTN